MVMHEIKVDQLLPERIHKPSNVSLFLYNAAIWNPHRIHYDETYTKRFEGHPKLVIDGPLMGDWMAQCVSNWLNDQGKIDSVEIVCRGNQTSVPAAVSRVEPGQVVIHNHPNGVMEASEADMQLAHIYKERGIGVAIVDKGKVFTICPAGCDWTGMSY